MEDDHYTVTPSSGNIYRDLGFEDPEAMLAKSKICIELARVILQKKLSKSAAARMIGLSTSKLNQIRTGQFQNVSEQQMSEYLAIIAAHPEPTQ